MPTTQSFAPNSNGDFVIDVNEMDGGNRNGWTLRNDIPGSTGGAALSWDGPETFSNPSNGNLSYSFTPTVTGVYYLNLASMRLKNPGGEHNDAFTRILGPNDNPLVARDGVKQDTVYSPNFIGGPNGPDPKQGWHKTFQTNDQKDVWNYSSANMDFVGIPLAYNLQAGVTYTAQIASRSNFYAIDQLQLVYDPTPPNVDPTKGQLEFTSSQTVPRNSELSDRGGTTNNGVAPVIAPIADLIVDETAAVDLDIVATDGNGNGTISLDFELERPNGSLVDPSSYTFIDRGNGRADFMWIAPSVPEDRNFTATVTATDNTGRRDVESFVIGVQDLADTPQPPPPTPGDEMILYRVNAGGPNVASTDGGPNWSADTAASNSPFLADASNNLVLDQISVNTNNTTLPSDAPGAVFQSQRAAATWSSDMAWAFEVGAPGLYEVRLFVREIRSEVSNPGERVFDVSAEGVVPAAFNDIDPSGDFGFRVGGLVSATVQVTDGTLNLEFLSEVRNPFVNAIEIIALDGGTTTPGGTRVEATVTADAEQTVSGSIDSVQSGADNDLEVGNGELAGFFFNDVSIASGASVLSATLSATSQRGQNVNNKTVTIGLDSQSEGVQLSGNGRLTDAFDFVSTEGLNGTLSANERVMFDVTQIVSQYLAANSSNSDGSYDLLFALDADPGVVRFSPEEFGTDLAAELLIEYA